MAFLGQAPVELFLVKYCGGAGVVFPPQAKFLFLSTTSRDALVSFYSTLCIDQVCIYIVCSHL